MMYPANYTVLDENEMMYVDGGGVISDWSDVIFDTLKKWIDNGLDWAKAQGIGGLAKIGFTAYGAYVDMVHIPKLIGALVEGFSLREIAAATFGFNDDGTVDFGKMAIGVLNAGAGTYALYRGGAMIGNLIRRIL